MMNFTRLESIRQDFSEIRELEIFEASDELERFSKDAYYYSPILHERLKNCCADIVVNPKTVEAALNVASVCVRHMIPLTVRGSGTGNYGQCVPLEGGVVMLMGAFQSIRTFDISTGVVTAECGCLLGDLERFLRQKGRQLRLAPSTLRSASVAGFIAGGSGGVGSVRWGFLRDPGHLLGLEVITLQSPPQKIQLDDISAEPLNHAYGTNGIITAVSLATAPAVNWQEVVINSEDWAKSVELIINCSEAAIDLHLCTLLEGTIVRHLPKWSGSQSDQHRLLCLVAPDGVSTLAKLAMKFGLKIIHYGSEKQGGRGLRELTWNHTTLHMRTNDPAWTYLQMLLPQPELPVMETLKNSWGDDLCWHLEAVRQQGIQRIAALPLIRWRGPKLLENLICQCRELGAVVFNPHVITVEDGGLGVVDANQVQAKRKFDPRGILNPGKLKGWV